MPGQPVAILEVTVDDATGEQLAHAVQALLDAGAYDAWLVPVVMKKGRPGFVVQVLGDPVITPRLRTVLRTATGSLGVRMTVSERWPAARAADTVSLDGHLIRMKISAGTVKAEHDDVARVARLTGRPLREVASRAEAAWREGDDRTHPADPLPARRAPDPVARLGRSHRGNHLGRRRRAGRARRPAARGRPGVSRTVDLGPLQGRGGALRLGRGRPGRPHRRPHQRLLPRLHRRRRRVRAATDQPRSLPRPGCDVLEHPGHPPSPRGGGLVPEPVPAADGRWLIRDGDEVWRAFRRVPSAGPCTEPTPKPPARPGTCSAVSTRASPTSTRHSSRSPCPTSTTSDRASMSCVAGGRRSVRTGRGRDSARSTRRSTDAARRRRRGPGLEGAADAPPTTTPSSTTSCSAKARRSVWSISTH